YLALFQKHKLAPGEKGVALVLAASVDQARTVFGYVRGFLEASPALAREVAGVKRFEIELRNGIVIAVHSNSYRTVPGRTVVAGVLGEVAFSRHEPTASPDVEVYSAVLPGLATTGGMLIGISTPYRKLGLLHQKHRDHFGVDGDGVLVVQGASKTFNPSLADAAIAAQRAAMSCGLHRIERLMRLQALKARPRRRRRPPDLGERPATAVAANVLNRTFEASAPNRKWIAVFTYVWTTEGWLYVAVVIDLFSRRVVGWSMSAAMTAQLVTDALVMAIWRRGKPDALLHHSDRGSQYTSEQSVHSSGTAKTNSSAVLTGSIWMIALWSW